VARSKEPDFVCPNCGADVAGGAKSCPECGSDENTGWSEDTYLDGVSLPDEDDDSVGERSHPKGFLSAANVLWVLVALLLIGLWLFQTLKG
jgi:hypothetical protein